MKTIFAVGLAVLIAVPAHAQMAGKRPRGEDTKKTEQKPQVERWVRNYQKLRAKLEAICELNHELLRAEP